ncbi:MAG: putative baseplate assembly protein [Deltaproteobacteria bacterium]|nr:putative baseplate assembly protein [Deltaproteobacteria bacterium]
MIPTPNLDDRGFDDIVEEAIRLIPQYCPEWTNYNKSDPGITLLELFAWMTEMVIYRLNRVPDNNYLAFLNMMGIRLRPPQPARTIVQFKVSEKTDMVVVNAGTRVATKPEGDLPALVYETERDLVGLNNKLMRCMSQHNKMFADNTGISNGETGTFEVFGGARSIERYLYLGDSRFSAFNEDSILIMRFEAQGSGDRQFHELLEWEYWDGNRWRELVRASMDLERNTCAFSGPPAFEQTSVNDVETFWIRGRLFEVPHDSEETVVDTITARIEVLGEGIPPEDAICNAEGDIFTVLDIDKNFAPFGKEPAVDSTFYFGSAEGLSQPDSLVKLEITMTDQNIADVARPSHDLVLRWEYHTGKRWKVLGKVTWADPDHPESEFDFSDTTRCFTQSGAVTFKRPADLGQTDVQGTETLWVRCRVEMGNYGSPGTYVLEDDTWVWKDDNPLRPPWFKEVVFKFQEQPHWLKTVFVYNDFVFTDHTKLASTEYKPFQVFQPVAEESPTLYLGWENPFPTERCSMYFNMEEREGLGGRTSLRSFDDRSDGFIEQRVVWEYWDGKSWSLLTPHDTTENFTQAGFVEFIGPADFRKSRRFGESLYWMRARLEQGGYDEPPRCNRILLNAVHVSNVTTYGDTLLGSSQGTPNQFFFMPRGPVLDGEVIVCREKDTLPPDEVEALRELWGSEAIIDDPDGDGFWVRWLGVDSFYDRGHRDRVYIKDIVTGEIRFGDGVHGMIPPKGDRSIRARMYRVGGGSAGNVPASTVNEMMSTLAFIEEVTNPYAAAGGCDMETVEEAKARAPHMLKARNRAVTIDDFEWLAREASNSVARVKCLPSTSREGEVTVIVVPRTATTELTEKPVPTVELLKRVRKYLNQRRLVSTVVNVVRPSYAECSLRIEIVAAQGGATDKIKKAIEVAVRRFLHPLQGWRSGKGWPFGRSLLKVDLYQVVESVDGVDLVDKIRIYDEARGGIEIEQLRVGDDQLIHLIDVDVVEKAHDRIV